MTEAKWRSCGDPWLMLDFLRSHGSDRKCRLLACGYFRSVWAGRPSNWCAEVVCAAEEMADGADDDAGYLAALSVMDFAWEEACRREPFDPGEYTKCNDAHRCLNRTREQVLGFPPPQSARFERFRQFLNRMGTWIGRGVRQTHPNAGLHCHLIRDIFGNPFRPVSADRRWLTSAAVDLARSMYDARDFTATPILADALEESGCDHPDVLAHCRGGGGPHVRGCWVVDLLLGKE